METHEQSTEQDYSNGPAKTAQIEKSDIEDIEDTNGPGSPSNSVSTMPEDDDISEDEDDDEGLISNNNEGGNTDELNGGCDLNIGATVQNDLGQKLREKSFPTTESHSQKETHTRMVEYDYPNGSKKEGFSGANSFGLQRIEGFSGANSFGLQRIEGRPTYQKNVPREVEEPTTRQPQGQQLPKAGLFPFSQRRCLQGAGVALTIALLGVLLFKDMSGQADARKFKNRAEAEFVNFMKKEFPSQREKEMEIFAKQVELSRRSTESNQQSVVYTLLYYNDHKTANDVGLEMAKYAASRFHNSSEIFAVNGQTCKEYIDTNLTSFKHRIEKTGTLLVTNFDKVNSELARKFHMICDKYTPFIREKAAYILVLKTTNKILLEKDDLFEWKQCAISTFKELWPDLEDAALDPLITRLTENIIKIYPEKK